MNRKTGFRTLVCSSLFLLLFAIPIAATAQTITGSILGTVTDSSGAVVPGATVTVTNESTNESSKTQTSDSGAYQIPYLNPGAYQISVSHAGFETTVQNHVGLSAQSRIVVNFSLPVGNTT